MASARRATIVPPPDAREPAAPATVRCAIYTRKSTDENLDTDFNTLDAQREAAEAYVVSQRSAGWVLLADRYDDGGYSGGNTERPAFQRLMRDVAAGRVDCVLVYKIDRLSRSLVDFAKMMETFEQHAISLVSVTQQFNTATSMGRLTVNILLSFAQFEREQIAERIRDKMGAARRKGKWVGGMPALGYDVAFTPGRSGAGRLVVNEAEAEQVRVIYQTYLRTGSTLETAKELNARGWTTKKRVTKNGERGGKPFDKTIVSLLLRNRVYRGEGCIAKTLGIRIATDASGYDKIVAWSLEDPPDVDSGLMEAIRETPAGEAWPVGCPGPVEPGAFDDYPDDIPF